jgi:hypothetical protein
LFDAYTQATEQATTVCDDDGERFEEGEDILVPDDVAGERGGPGVGKKKGESHRTGGFTEKEDLVLCKS